MTSPQSMRRHATLAIVLVCGLVCGGLAWATRSAIELDRRQARDREGQDYRELRTLALSRLDNLLAPILHRERETRYEFFRPYYKPSSALDEHDFTEIRNAILLPSPLRELEGPDWLLMHFQASEAVHFQADQKWSSPQVETRSQSVAPAWAIPHEERRRMAGPENWLAALEDRYSPTDLQVKLERAMAAYTESAGTALGEDPTDASGDAPLSDLAVNTWGDLSPRAAAFVQRGARLVEMRNRTPTAVCLPQVVAAENLQTGGETLDTDADGCIEVTPTHMAPIWLEDLTLDGHKQLALVRSVAVEGSNFCTLQGVLIDWPRLKEQLETEVRRLFPNAVVEPVSADEPLQPGSDRLHMIPARLETGTAMTATPALSTSLKRGLAVAWGTTLLALIAIGYGLMKYVTLAERRMRFVAAVTHELRTPLTTFQLYADLLNDQATDDPQRRRQYVRTLRQSAARLGRIVENVLAYSRIGDAQPDLSYQAVPPIVVLESTRAATTDTCAAAGKDVVIENRCHDDIRLETDPEFITQILSNLVENACKYSAEAEDPRIWLTADVNPRGEVVLEVDDAGPGVAPQDRRAVFLPFRRSNSGSSRKSSGMGLGLALSQYWANCLDGRLALKRSARNGTHLSCFSLTLPKNCVVTSG